MVKRYRLDTECIIDMEEGKVLSMVQIRNKLNKLNDENEQLKNEIKELEEKNENLLAKLKYTCEQINYSERLREMMK